MTLQQLSYIVEIFKCGSISAAAKKLFIAQPSLSKAIKNLEDELGITILERSRRGTVFTAQGIELLGYANSIIERTTELMEHFDYYKIYSRKVQFAISAQHYVFAVDALIDMINKMDKELPNYTVTIREGYTSDVIDDILTRKSDIGLIFISDTTRNFINRMLIKNRIEFTTLGEYAPYVYINRWHPLAMQKSITMDMLTSYPYVRYDQKEDLYNYSEEIIIPESCSKAIYVTDRSTMLSIIKNTNAYTTGTGFLLPNIMDINIISLPLSRRMDRIQIGWIKQKGIELSPEVEEYIGLLSQSIKKCSWGNKFLDITP